MKDGPALCAVALVWVGLPDPGNSREELQRSSDQEAMALRSLIQGWPEIDQDGSGLSASKILARLKQPLISTR